MTERIRGRGEKFHDSRQEKRESIMNAALRVFSKKGYSPAAVDEVAMEAGIAKGTLYLYFADKEDLFCSTIVYVMDRLKNYLESNLKNETDPLRSLEKVIFLLLKFFAENISIFSLIEIAINENIGTIHKRLQEIMIDRRKGFYEFLGSVFERGVENGIIRDDIEKEDFITCVDGVVMGELRRIVFENMRRQEPIKVNISKRAESVFKILTEGILKK